LEKIQTGLEGLYIIQHKVYRDDRGVFVKTYNQSIYVNLRLDVGIKESYFSVSHKDVIRGMHFQTPPDDCVKLVSIIQGAILDVVLDIRTASPTYGKCFSILLKAEEGKSIYIPKGFAHGFKALENNTIVEYNQTSGYSLKNDDGILYSSFDFDWRIENPIVSKRDSNLIPFTNYKGLF